MEPASDNSRTLKWRQKPSLYTIMALVLLSIAECATNIGISDQLEALRAAIDEFDAGLSDLEGKVTDLEDKISGIEDR